VRKALELMEAQRLVTRRQGRGTFVSDQTSNEQTARFCNIRAADGEHVNGRVVSVEVSEGAADDQERLRLRLADGDAVYRIHRVWRHGDQNFLVAEASVSAARFPGLASKTEAAGNIGALAREYGILLGRHEVRIALGVPPARTAQTLGIAPGTTVMRFERTVFMLDGWPVEHATSHCHLAGSYYQIESG
jgi:GntR family transcriptional regulator